VHLVNVLSEGVKGGPKAPGSEWDAAADATRDAPQARARDRFPVVDGPEARRDPTIGRFVGVLKRPYAITRAKQNFAIEDAPPALQEEIQVIGTDSANVGFIVSARDPAFGHRMAPQRRHPLRSEGHVHRPERPGRVRCDIRAEQEAHRP